MPRDIPTDVDVAMYSPVSRRQALLGIGTLATGGVGLAVVGTEDARAQVDIGEFSVADKTFNAESVSPVVDVPLAYSYDVGSAVVSALRFELSVGETVVDEYELSTTRSTLTADTTLSAPVTDSEAWVESDFAPEVGSSIARDIAVSVRFDVIDDSGSSLVGASAKDTATVEVAHPQESTYSAQIGGRGVFRTPE